MAETISFELCKLAAKHLACKNRIRPYDHEGPASIEGIASTIEDALLKGNDTLLGAAEQRGRDKAATTVGQLQTRIAELEAER